MENSWASAEPSDSALQRAAHHHWSQLTHKMQRIQKWSMTSSWARTRLLMVLLLTSKWMACYASSAVIACNKCNWQLANGKQKPKIGFSKCMWQIVCYYLMTAHLYSCDRWQPHENNVKHHVIFCPQTQGSGASHRCNDIIAPYSITPAEKDLSFIYTETTSLPAVNSAQQSDQ